MAYIYFFIKFCKERKHAEEFRAGQLYLNALNVFMEGEDDDDGRADPYEAPAQWHQPKDVTVQVAGFTLAADEMTFPVVVQEGHQGLINVLCMYAGSTAGFGAVNDQNLEAFRRHMQIPAECSRMGAWAAVVRNVAVFQQRFDAEIRRNSYGLTRGPVSYFDESAFSGTVERPLFWKRRQFAWQREYRFAVRTPASKPSPLILDVGDLSDICSIFPFEQLPGVAIKLRADGA
jgi:hypothetical protein